MIGLEGSYSVRGVWVAEARGWVVSGSLSIMSAGSGFIWKREDFLDFLGSGSDTY